MSPFEDDDILNRCLQVNDDALASLTSALKQAINKAGGLHEWAHASLNAERWSDLGLDPPTIFLESECWFYRPADLLTDLMHNFNCKRDKICVRGSPNEPVPGAPISRVLRQLFRPEPKNTYYAVNLIGQAPMRILETLSKYRVYLDDDIVTTTNLTPAFSFVDLHIGKRHIGAPIE